MNGLRIFSYSAKQVRTVMRNDEPWFVLKDVCAALDIDNSSNVSTRLDDDEKDIFKSPPDGFLDVLNRSITCH